MSIRPARLRLVGVALATSAIAVLSAGCAAGQHAATSEETPAVDANVGTNVGTIQIRAVAIAAPPTGTSYPKGSDADLIVTFVNVGRTADTLTGVTSPAATSWRSFDSAAAASAAATASSAGSSAPSDSTATATATDSASAAPQPGQSVTIPAGTSVAFGVPYTQSVLMLEGTTASPLFTATSVPITFTFTNAGSATVQVPVQISDSRGSMVVPSPTSSGD